MPADALLDLLDPTTKRNIFIASLETLHVTPQLKLDTLQICIQLAPTLPPQDLPSLSDLWQKILEWIVLVQQTPNEKTIERLHQIADICLSNGFKPAQSFYEKLYKALEGVRSKLDQPVSTPEEQDDRLKSAAAYLRFLQYSFWLPSDRCHLICRDTIPLISKLVGYQGLEDAALDALSALLTLLKGSDNIALASTLDHLPLAAHKLAMSHPKSLWERIQILDPQCQETYSSKITKVLFQWISQVHVTGDQPACLQDQAYWYMLSNKLSNGFGEEQKYCLGIISHSLSIAQEPINTIPMVYHGAANERQAYDHYITIFRTIVLNRYANQVEACLPDLTTLLGSESKITSVMTASLLSAALHARVQEGIRKLIGYWYINHILKNHQSFQLDGEFFTRSFLPWATEGSLFTSSVKSTRTETVCLHGDAIANVIAQLVSAECTKFSDNQNIPQDGHLVILRVIRFILKADGKIFQSAILYLLEGLVRGLEACSITTTPDDRRNWLTNSQLIEVADISRLIGLPEISSDLLNVYCQQICTLIRDDFSSMNRYEFTCLNVRVSKLAGLAEDDQPHFGRSLIKDGGPHTIGRFLDEMRSSKYRSIQGDKFALSCKRFIAILDQTPVAFVSHEELFDVLQAFWEEAERCEFGRQVAMHLPDVLFHPLCVDVCVDQHHVPSKDPEICLDMLLSKALLRLQQLSQGRSYILSVLATSVRRAVFSNFSIVTILPFEDFVIEYLNNPPSSKPEFLFEMAAAEKLRERLKHISYTSYYGQREWHAYAALIDLFRRWPQEQLAVAKGILSRLVKPWRDQKTPVPVKSAWKTTLQLQIMLILSEFCIAESDVDNYIESLTHALSHESWPRYRYLLEWIIARIYNRFQEKTSRILDDLNHADRFSPAHIASLVKLGLLVAPFKPQNFANNLAVHLVCFSTSPKVAIRHEANYALPILFDLAEERGWCEITGDSSFAALNKYVRQLSKYNAEPWTIRTLRLDAIRDFSLTKIFQGRYLTIESPERERATYEDFVELEGRDHAEGMRCSPPRIDLGEKLAPVFDAAVPMGPPKPGAESNAPVNGPGFLQTKAGFDIDSLYPTTSSPFAKNQRPASVIVIASLIDNPTNLGGLSRISESFGLEALYIDDVKKTAHKDFKATSVTSEKHFPIRALKIPDIPQFLIDAKSKGYQVVGVEQTDRSGILGEEDQEALNLSEKGARFRKDLGTLPRQCVLVLGSEKGGITPEVLTVIDRCVEIRTVGVTRSLNVQTAGGIAVYEWWREWGRKI